jgi:hypothetical protein
MSQIRKIIYRLFAWAPHKALEPSKEPIDVVIPIIAKDLKVLPLCLEGVRCCVSNVIKDIYIVAPDEPEIRKFCQLNDLIFVNENTIFGITPKQLGLIIKHGDGLVHDRSGWLFQQFVKLSGAIGTCRYYLCIDADHVLIRPHVFLTNKKQTVFYMSYEKHKPYYDNIRRLLPGISLSALSYVDHKMLFDKQMLEKLHQALTANGAKSWTEAILKSLDRTQYSCFSEFELYGNFCYDKVQRPWLQKRLRYKKLADYDTLQRKYAATRWSLTFPDYIN